MTVMIDAAVDTAAVAKKKTPAVTPEGVNAELVGRLVEQARAAGMQRPVKAVCCSEPTERSPNGPIA
ncbi:hypothetical protein [Dactylosporangium sp. NPDC050588]|uniref:hypothetical protein n=1 Tax=Dactylosporangium sp. NPDC050588 TaxID=3157211 RepID=UPI0033CA0F8F